MMSAWLLDMRSVRMHNYRMRIVLLVDHPLILQSPLPTVAEVRKEKYDIRFVRAQAEIEDG